MGQRNDPLVPILVMLLTAVAVGGIALNNMRHEEYVLKPQRVVASKIEHWLEHSGGDLGVQVDQYDTLMALRKQGYRKVARNGRNPVCRKDGQNTEYELVPLPRKPRLVSITVTPGYLGPEIVKVTNTPPRWMGGELAGRKK